MLPFLVQAKSTENFYLDELLIDVGDMYLSPAHTSCNSSPVNCSVTPERLGTTLGIKLIVQVDTSKLTSMLQELNKPLKATKVEIWIDSVGTS